MVQETIKEMKKDEILRATLAGGEAVCFLARTTKLCDDARAAHGASPLASAVLGRTLTMTAIMCLSSLKNDDDRLTVTLDGKSLIGKVVCGGRTPALVKGYVEDPYLELPLNEKGKLDVGRAVGHGSLAISRDLGLKEPYMGRVPLVTGEIGEDFTYYFAKSEQTPTAIALGVLVDTDLSARQAGGFIVQLMPGAGDDIAVKLEENLQQLPPVTTLLEEGLTAEAIIEKITEGLTLKYLDEAHYEYRCDCNHDKICRALISLGRDELTDMIEKDGGAEITCQFCPKVYRFNAEELRTLLADA